MLTQICASHFVVVLLLAFAASASALQQAPAKFLNDTTHSTTSPESPAIVNCTDSLPDEHRAIASGIVPQEVCTWYGNTWFERTGNYVFTTGAQRVSAYTWCGDGQTCSFAAGYQHSVATQWSAGLSWDIMEGVKGNLGFSYTETSTTSLTYSIQFKGPCNGYLWFDAKYNQAVGWYHNERCNSCRPCNPSTTWVDARVPATINGQADGTWGVSCA